MAHAHIAADGCDRVFCGIPIPLFILEQWDDKNPYLNTSNVTCHGCLGEWHDGRRSGFRSRNSEITEDTENAPLPE